MPVAPPTVMTIETVSWYCQMSPRGQNDPPLGTTDPGNRDTANNQNIQKRAESDYL